MISRACFSLARKHKRKVIKPRENERRQAQIQPRRKGNILIFAFVLSLRWAFFTVKEALWCLHLYLRLCLRC